MPVPGLTLSARSAAKLRYLVVVGSAAIIDLGGFVLLVASGAAVPVAAALSFLVAAAYNYLLISRIVFRQRSQMGRFGLFLAVGLFGLFVNTGVTWMASAFGIPHLFAKGAGIGVAFLFNTALNICVVFGPGYSRSHTR